MLICFIFFCTVLILLRLSFNISFSFSKRSFSSFILLSISMDKVVVVCILFPLFFAFLSCIFVACIGLYVSSASNKSFDTVTANKPFIVIYFLYKSPFLYILVVLGFL